MTKKVNKSESTAYNCECGSNLMDSRPSSIRRHETMRKHLDRITSQSKAPPVEETVNCARCGFDPTDPNQNHGTNQSGCFVEQPPQHQIDPIVEIPETSEEPPEISVRAKTARLARQQGYDIPGGQRRRRQRSNRWEQQRDREERCELYGHDIGPAMTCTQCKNKLKATIPKKKVHWSEIRPSVDVEGEIRRIHSYVDHLKGVQKQDKAQLKKNRTYSRRFPIEVNRILQDVGGNLLSNIRSPKPALNSVRKAIENRTVELKQELALSRKNDIYRAERSITPKMEEARSIKDIQAEIGEVMTTHAGHWNDRQRGPLSFRLRKLRIELNDAMLREKLRRAAILPKAKAQMEHHGMSHNQIIPESTMKAVERVQDEVEARRRAMAARRKLANQREEQKAERELVWEKERLSQLEQQQGQVNNITMLRCCPNCGRSGKIGDRCWNKDKHCRGVVTVVPRAPVQRSEPAVESQARPVIRPMRKAEKKEDMTPGFIGLTWDDDVELLFDSDSLI